MAKRRKKNNTPNLPDAVLARARKNAGVEEPEAVDDVTDDSESGEDEAISVTERAARRRKLSSVQLERTKKRGEMSTEMISDVLNNPTKVVTEDELREEYQHVLFDLRNMGLLAAVLIVVMLGLAVVFPPF